MLLKKDRRRAKRYVVSWEGLLEVRFPDFHGQIPVTISDFSEFGALLNSEQIFLNSRHLIAATYHPELDLKIFSPEGTFTSIINIRWYDWSVEKNMFEIGVEFINLSKENKAMIQKLIRKLRPRHTYNFKIFKNLFLRKMKN
jgi:hypothetical protein